MQFKALAFLLILSILLFTGCHKKDKSKEQVKEEEKKEAVIEKTEKKTEFQLKAIDNTIIDVKVEDGKIIVKDYPNKMVLLSFFATWCPPCKAEIPNLIDLQSEYKNDLVIISVLVEEMKSDEEISAFVKEHKINYTVVNSPENFDLAKALGGIKSIPTLFLIDKNSNIFQKYVGLVPNEMMEIDLKKVLEK